MIHELNFLTPHDGSPNHIETISLICSANQWTGFYKTRTSAMKQLKDGHYFVHYRKYVVQNKTDKKYNTERQKTRFLKA